MGVTLTAGEKCVSKNIESAKNVNSVIIFAVSFNFAAGIGPIGQKTGLDGATRLRLAFPDVCVECLVCEHKRYWRTEIRHFRLVSNCCKLLLKSSHKSAS